HAAVIHVFRRHDSSLNTTNILPSAHETWKHWGEEGGARDTPMSQFTREECLQRLRAQVAARRPIIGGGAGGGLSAKGAEAGGIDLIILYNSGRFRMAGRGSLSGLMPYGDANQIVLDMAREVLPVVKNTPVLAGVCGTDPFRVMRRFLRDVHA